MRASWAFLNSLCITVKFFFFFSFQPFPSVRGGHSVSSFSTPFYLQHPFPSHQLPAYLPLLHLKIFSLVSLFSSFPIENCITVKLNVKNLYNISGHRISCLKNYTPIFINIQTFCISYF